MKPPSPGGVALGFLCPCGKGSTIFCQWCHRALCGEHHAGGPFAENGAVVLKAVCLPKCDSAWWTQLPRASPDN